MAQRNNRKTAPWRIISIALVLCGLLCAIPLVVMRDQMERTGKQVELVFDYRDLLQSSSYRGNAMEYVRSQLEQLRIDGFTSMAVYESTLEELEWAHHVRVIPNEQLNEWTGVRSSIVVFLHQEALNVLRPLIERSFVRAGIEVRPMQVMGRDALEIVAPIEAARLQTMEPDPIAIKQLRAMGFHILVRLSDRRQPFDAQEMKQLLQQLSAEGVRTIAFDGPQVTGAGDEKPQRALAHMGRLLRETNIKLAMIELAKPQIGFAPLAHHTQHRVVRMHSVPTAVLSDQEEVIDRVLLAVRERNIRIVYWNAEVQYDKTQGKYKDGLPELHRVFAPEAGLLSSLREAGFSIGGAQVAQERWTIDSTVRWSLKAGVVIGAIALIAWVIGLYVAAWSMPAFVLGVIGAGSLAVVQRESLLVLLAFGVAVAGVTWAMISIVQGLEKQQGQMMGWARWRWSGLTLARAVLLALLAVVYVVALLDAPAFLLGIQLFRGVSVFHVLPVLTVLLYVLYVRAAYRWSGVWAQVRSFCFARINLLTLVGLVLLGGALFFYLSRTGNAGKALDVERWMRQGLQDALGVRPRTKEILFAYPALCLTLATRKGVRSWLVVVGMLAGTIGLLSLVGTFAHLHTPLEISLLRAVYGVLIGFVIGSLVWGVGVLLRKMWRTKRMRSVRGRAR